ncbi:MAG TPA: MFS transporter [Acidimicrobiia bacterium]
MAGGGRGSAMRAPLHVRDFRLLLSATAISATGDFLFGVALFVYIYDRTHSATWLAAANIVRFLPYMLLSTFGGVIADRYDRRTLMIVIDTARGALMVALAIVAARDGGLALIVAITAVSTIFNTAYRPCANATVPSVVTEDDLAAANTILITIENVALALGPALGGILLLLGSATTAFVVNAVSFFISALLLTRVRTRLQTSASDEEPDESSSFGARIAQGFQAIRSNSTAATLVALTVSFTFAWGLELVLYPLVASKLLHTGDGLAFMFAAIGIGGIVAAGLTGRASRSDRAAAVIIATGVISALPIVALAFVHTPAVAYTLLAIQGAATIIADVITMTMLQRVVSGDVLGRVLGILDSLSVTGIIVGSALAPLFVSAIGLQSALIVAGALVLVLTLLVVPRARDIDRAAAATTAALAERVALLSNAEMFEAAAQTTIEALAASLVAEHVAAGTVVVREGDEPDDMWLVAAGTLEVTSLGAGGSDVVIDHQGPGGYFGEIGLLRGIPRTATVTATSDCDLWRLSGDDFLRVVNQGNDVSANLRTGMTASLGRVARAKAAD